MALEHASDLGTLEFDLFFVYKKQTLLRFRHHRVRFKTQLLHIYSRFKRSPLKVKYVLQSAKASGLRFLRLLLGLALLLSGLGFLLLLCDGGLYGTKLKELLLLASLLPLSQPLLLLKQLRNANNI